MGLHVPPDNLDSELLLLPDLHSVEQQELVTFLGDEQEELCHLSELTESVVLWQDRQLLSALEDREFVVIRSRGDSIRCDHYEWYTGIESDLSDPDIILVPRLGISADYLVAVLKTELFRRQMGRAGLIEGGHRGPLLERLSGLLVPRPTGRLGTQLRRKSLLSNSDVPEASSPVLHIPSPLSEAEAVANAVSLADGELQFFQDPAIYGLACYIPHLTSRRLAQLGMDCSSYTFELLSPQRNLQGDFETASASVASDAFRDLAVSLGSDSDGVVWLNRMDRNRSDVGLPVLMARHPQLRQLVRMTLSQGTQSVDRRIIEQFETRLNQQARDFETGAETSEDLESEGAFVRTLRHPAVFADNVEAVSSFYLGELRDALLELIPHTIGAPEDRNTVPLAVTGSFGSGKTHFLAFLRAVARSRTALTRIDQSVLPCLKALSGRYVAVTLRAETGATLSSQLIEQLQGLISESRVPGISDIPTDKGTIAALEAVADGLPESMGLLILIDEFEACAQYSRQSRREALQLLNDLAELQSRTSIRTVISTATTLAHLANETEGENKLSLWRTLQVLNMPEWSRVEFSRYADSSFHPALVVRLADPPIGPGGVIIKPCRPIDRAAVLDYRAHLYVHVVEQMRILRQLRERVTEEVVGRIRHMFKNRIGIIRKNLRDVIRVGEENAWGGELIVSEQVAHEQTKRGRSREFYRVSNVLRRSQMALDSLDTVVDRISQYYRAGEPTPERLDLNEVVSREVERWRAARPDVTVVMQLDTIPAPVVIDKESLREAIDNVLLNSSEHLEVGGGHELAVTTRVQRDRIILEISNSGPGSIPDGASQVGITTKDSRGGLGLSIVTRNVHEAGGTYVLTARSDKPGATNRFEFPHADWQKGRRTDA